MKANFFCAESSRKSGEDAIGNGLDYDQYILVECPAPWSANEFESRFVPNNLRNLIRKFEEEYDNNFLLISQEKKKQQESTKVIIFSKQKEFSHGCKKQEFNLGNIEQVAPFISDYLAGNKLNVEPVENSFRDILICTHGSHDKCCAKYGEPFYREALTTVSDLALEKVRIWRSSHFGGHRFAPTAIDFPEGRYYGRLDRASFTSILTRTGDIQNLKNVYRGWGILPPPVQVLERELILIYGWNWFNYKASGQIIEQNEDETFYRVELTFEMPNRDRYCYRGDVISDKNHKIYLKGSCDSEEEYPFPQYEIKNIIDI